MFVVKYTNPYLIIIMAPPKYILTANESETDKDKQIANLKAMVDEREKVAQKAQDEKEEEVKTAIKAILL